MALVVIFALKLARVDMAKSCASAAIPAVKTVVATNTSSIENPRAPLVEDLFKAAPVVVGQPDCQAGVSGGEDVNDSVC